MKSKNHSEYQKQYRKHKVHRVVIFSKEEYQTLLNAAKEHKRPFSTFIRELALAQLAKQYVVPNDELSKSVALLLTRYGTNLNQIAHVANATWQITPEKITGVQTQFQKMKQEIIDLYNKPIPVEEVIRSAIHKDPEFKHRIILILKECS